jgi:CheY-like chemotaxis protein
MPDGFKGHVADSVLVIDDDPCLLNSFVDVLETYGLPVATARDGYEALAAFRWFAPTVVLADILMPEQCDAALAMRRARPAVKIIAMSGRADRADFLTIAKKFGADAIVHKPFEVSDLVKLLRTFLQQRRR